MSELVQGYVPDWYTIRVNAIKATEIILNAYCIIEPFSYNIKDFQLWNKQKDKFMKSKGFNSLHAYVSKCCKHSVDYDEATSIFEAVYNAMKPDGNKAVFMKENTKKIAEFNAYVLSRCNENATIVETQRSPVFEHEVKYDNVSASAPQALAIKDHLECIDLTLDALDLTGKSLPEQICVIKDHLKCVEVLLGDLVTSMIPMLF